ncbi:MAG: GNAT family N-acetyltransferase [Sphingobacteriales bacterium 50-39]|nr:GNAT family N-acetyltransferase [Sphingobacteriales bacterium]OJW57819.1 MAG: GNAT family N-acetyltransferase [Sphingobacteriales bacterium 50-39]
MDRITIRPAVMGDLPTLRKFEQALIAAERPFDPTLADDPIHYYELEEMIHASEVRLAVAAYDGEIIGSGYARIDASKSYLRHKRHAYFGFMYVLPEHRGKGVNGRIMEHLKEWSLLQHIEEIRLDVYTDNVPAIKAYEKAGFRLLMTEMRLLR